MSRGGRLREVVATRGLTVFAESYAEIDNSRLIICFSRAMYISSATAKTTFTFIPMELNAIHLRLL